MNFTGGVCSLSLSTDRLKRGSIDLVKIKARSGKYIDDGDVVSFEDQYGEGSK